MLKATAVVAILGTLVAAPAQAAGDALLVRLETRDFSTMGEGRGELLIYRDGGVLSRSESRKGASAETLVTLSFGRMQASEEQMRAFGTALAENHVGLQAGGCFLQTESVHTFLLQTQLDWYGRDPRRNSFTADTRFPQECNAEVYAILDAIRELVTRATFIDGKTTTDLLDAP